MHKLDAVVYSSKSESGRLGGVRMPEPYSFVKISSLFIGFFESFIKNIPTPQITLNNIFIFIISFPFLIKVLIQYQ